MLAVHSLSTIAAVAATVAASVVIPVSGARRTSRSLRERATRRRRRRRWETRASAAKLAEHQRRKAGCIYVCACVGGWVSATFVHRRISPPTVAIELISPISLVRYILVVDRISDLIRVSGGARIFPPSIQKRKKYVAPLSPERRDLPMMTTGRSSPYDLMMPRAFAYIEDLASE